MPDNPTTPIPADLERDLRKTNRWWAGEALPVLPALRRWAFEPVLGRLRGGLAPVTALRGPRQVGKSTLMLQVIQTLLAEGVDPRRILYAQFDLLPTLAGLRQPLLELSWWFEEHVLGATFNEMARKGEAVYLLFDEVQNLDGWAPQLKHLVDLNTVRVLVTGSSALRIEEGRDSLAGRLSTLEMGPLHLREVAEWRGFGALPAHLPLNGLAPLKEQDFWQELRRAGEDHAGVRREAFAALAERGGYPSSQVRADRPWEEVADQLNETVIRRAIRHDLPVGGRGERRDPALLEEVFRLACRYVGQAPAPALYLDELQRVAGAVVGWMQVQDYLRFLDGTLLIRLIPPLEIRLKRRGGAAKLCLCDHALRAAWLQEAIPLTEAGLQASPHLADLAGRVAESIVGYYLSSLLHLDVAHFPARPAEPEVDYVLTVGEQRIPVEVKFRRRVTPDDTLGLRSFIGRSHYRAPFGLLVTLTDEPGSDDPQIVSLPLSSLLLLR